MALSTNIGPYRVLRLVDQGGQGSVYLGYDERLHRRVAIKIYCLPADQQRRDQILEEARVVASIQSEKVVQVFDLIVAQNNIAMIMEYVPGCDLEELLHAATLSLSSVLTIATDLAGALTVARQQRIVHGDLKAHNVLITAEGHAKLADFGIARMTGSSGIAVIEGGSLSAVSPEQYLGQPLDVRSDLFALGCLLYRMLTGQQPFLRGDRLDVTALLHESPMPLHSIRGDLPLELCDLVDSLLSKNPQDRPSDTLQIRCVLRELARTVPLAVTGSLQRESRDYFRGDEPGDVPPAVPMDLQESHVSLLEKPDWRDLPLLRRLPKALRPVAFSAAVFLLAVGLVLVLRDALAAPTTLYIAAPDLRIESGMEIPQEVSSRWLVELVREVASEHLGPVFVTGPVGADRVRTLRVASDRSPPVEQLSLALRCSGDLCFASLNRDREGIRTSEYAVLLPEMTGSDWGQAVQGMARALYR